MNNYIGVKQIKASELMTRAKYCEYRGWSVPENEDPNELVYLVEYEKDENSKQNHPDHEGYISMSPKEVFEKAYRLTDGLTFGLAVEALKLGKKVCRSGWNGRGMFVYMNQGRGLLYSELSATCRKHMDSEISDIVAPHDACVELQPNFTIKNVNNSLSTWVPSINDCLAEDWIIIDNTEVEGE